MDIELITKHRTYNIQDLLRIAFGEVFRLAIMAASVLQPSNRTWRVVISKQSHACLTTLFLKVSSKETISPDTALWHSNHNSLLQSLRGFRLVSWMHSTQQLLSIFHYIIFQFNSFHWYLRTTGTSYESAHREVGQQLATNLSQIRCPFQK